MPDEIGIYCHGGKLASVVKVGKGRLMAESPEGFPELDFWHLV